MRPIAGTVLLYQCPVSFRMIEMAGVTELVDHQVFDRLHRQEQQLIVEADIADWNSYPSVFSGCECLPGYKRAPYALRSPGEEAAVAVVRVVESSGVARRLLRVGRWP